MTGTCCANENYARSTDLTSQWFSETRTRNQLCQKIINDPYQQCNDPIFSLCRIRNILLHEGLRPPFFVIARDTKQNEQHVRIILRIPRSGALSAQTRLPSTRARSLDVPAMPPLFSSKTLELRERMRREESSTARLSATVLALFPIFTESSLRSPPSAAKLIDFSVFSQIARSFVCNFPKPRNPEAPMKAQTRDTPLICPTRPHTPRLTIGSNYCLTTHHFPHTRGRFFFFKAAADMVKSTPLSPYFFFKYHTRLQTTFSIHVADMVKITNSNMLTTE